MTFGKRVRSGAANGPADKHQVQSGPCRLRARELFLVAADLADAIPAHRPNVLRLLDHAATAMEEAEHWSDLATSARHFHQQREAGDGEG